MTLLVDPAPLVALADRRDPLRQAVRAVHPLQGGAFELLPQR
ncbi:MAG: hypothetical protein ACRDRI_16835 [Pseudonocardiaceae bacterium]